ncbi:putative ATPase family associated domain-containing protein [Phytophthora infestans]|uniref:Putative ATPase family associated domain-containing protein n=1 Tax=Phytophthora infestans TaxID=4787 RepID=A0A8S9U716_PHYIN|nr:putative ATPase family associated domain-containing protein [Phytophthora infestans]
MIFELASWCLEDYKKAVLNDDFFRNVVTMFPQYRAQNDPKKEAAERTKLLQEKYFVAGGNARLMFEVTTATAIEALNKALEEASNIEPYLQGFVGDSSSRTVKYLLARYDSPHGYDVRFVSEYVVRHFTTLMGPRLIQNFARACSVNPSTDGFTHKAWFFAQLSHNGLPWSVYVESTLQRRKWERSSIVFFDPDKYPIGVSLDVPQWVAPVQWSQGGYDAVFIDKAIQLVRFVQVTRAECHTFDDKYFIDLLSSLDLDQVAVVELCFVVPMVRLETFRLPVSKEEFKKNVVEVASTPPRATRSHPDQTFIACCANVMAIGVDYETTDHHPVEASRIC